MVGQCTALNLSDEKRCQTEATSLNSLFCVFHSKQCYGLYKGYKKRNLRLDALAASPPDYLAKNSVPLANQTFADLQSEPTLKEVHDYLFVKYTLLDRVIRARKLHHSRFFSLTLDYGHQHYLDGLSNEKFIVLRALERIERRTAEVLYKQERWFSWVRQCQDEEEAHREKESKRIKLEAALFKRHMKELETRMRDLRTKENKQRQDEYLDQVYHERLAQETEEDDEDWDPIEDVIENERGNFVDLIKYFLWQNSVSTNADEPPVDANSGGAPSSQNETTPHADALVTNESSDALKPSKGKNKKKPKVKAEATIISVDEAKTKMETRSEMRLRLKEGSKLKHELGEVTYLMKGSVENPTEIRDRTFALPDDEIDRLVEDVYEIKQLLFCRLLLSYASLLPAALRANSVEEFLNDEDISAADLRELALKMEQPGLQEVRDACADLMRGDDEGDAETTSDDEDKELDTAIRAREAAREAVFSRKGALPKSWSSQREKKFQMRQESLETVREEAMGGSDGAYVDFGVIDDAGQYQKKKMQVKICGRSIYNYPSSKSMMRGGWLQFCIIAKDSKLYDCIQLCRSWDEFFELNILAIFQYFPAADWCSWVGDRLKQQQLELGFIPYFQFTDADKLTFHNQSGRARHGGRRTHAISESRNFICAQMKRDDPASRRFIQYLSMQTHTALALVRDVKTGRILVKPPERELWLDREKVGVGRAAKNTWQNTMEVGPAFFKKMDQHRRWHFGFTDYYDIYVWNLQPGSSFATLYMEIQETLFKAHRFCTPADVYNPMAPILRTLTRDRDTQRVRDIKAGEDVMSIYDDIHSSETKFMFRDTSTNGKIGALHEEAPGRLFYNECDALEDQVLFPGEAQGDSSKSQSPFITNALHRLEFEGPSIDRFIYDLDSDEELPDPRDPVGRLTGGENDDSSDDESIATEDLEESDEENQTEEQKQALDVFTNWIVNEPRPTSMHEEYMMWSEREKSKIFKESWHKADLEPGAPEKYVEMNDMIKGMEGYYRTLGPALIGMRLLQWLEVHPMEHRHVIRDMRRATAMMYIFFSPGAGFFDSEKGAEFKDSALLDQSERAQTFLVRKTHESCKCLPEKIWEEWDKLDKKKYLGDIYPTEWDKAIRPTVAHLYKEGIICPSYTDSYVGQAIAAHDSITNRLDLFIDYRDQLLNVIVFPHLQDPCFPLSTLRIAARDFSKDHPSARFSLLRLWSAPHFYPLMFSFEKRHEFAFSDPIGRVWHWKFIPKDMGCSEWSIHHQARLRIDPFKHQFGKKIMLRRDLYLVMGEDEEELLKLSTAVVFAVQTRPWRLEVDLWRSFVNVDLGFLEGLADRWLE